MNERSPTGALGEETILFDGKGDSDGKRRPPPQRDNLISLLDDAELWHSPEREAFATVHVNGHMENLAIRSRSFAVWLAGQYYEKTEAATGEQALKDAIRAVEARAIHRGPKHRVFVRIGEIEDGIVLDLGDEAWRAIVITRDGWEIVSQQPVKFIRSPAMTALPEPEPGESINMLKPFVNAASDEDFALMIGWLVMAFRPRGPYPILVINGEHGSAKSTTAEALHRLVDPIGIDGRGPPREERDLFIAAVNAWCLSYDNLSGMPGWLSDALCRLSSGGGFTTRELHSDRSEVLLRAQRPIILNGIPDLSSRADLDDRSILVTLPSVGDDRRRTEIDFWREFELERPFILGALLNGVAGALRMLPEIVIKNPPRMADFAYWVTAAEEGLRWDPGTLMKSYARNRARAVETSIEADPVAQAVRDLADGRDFEGTPTETLAKLGEFVSESVRKSRVWPSVNKLRSRLRRAQAPLRQLGVVLDLDLRSGGKENKRLIGIRRPDRDPSPPI